MNAQYIPITIIGIITFLGMLCLIMDMIYSSNNTEDHIVYINHQPLEESLPEEDDEDYANVLIPEDNDFYTNELDSLS